MSRSKHTDVVSVAPALQPLEPRRFFTVEQAQAADTFIDSIGVNTHLNINDQSTNPYDKAATLTTLGVSGIRHVRSAVLNTDGNSRLTTLYNGYGIQALLTNQNTGNLTSTANYSAQPYAEAVDGLNEPDNFVRSYNGYTDNPATGDYTATRQYNQDLYDAVKTASGKPVVSSAFGTPLLSPYDAGSSFDVEGLHPYPGTSAPGTYYKLDSVNLPAGALMAPGQNLPVYATEAGYYSGTDTGHVTDWTMGKYLPRLLAENFNHGIDRTYLYEFADEFAGGGKEGHYGMINMDGTPKTAYTEVKNLISTLNERTWNPSTHQFSTLAPASGTLDYTMTRDAADASGNPADLSDVHHLLLRKANGEYDLMLWREVSDYANGAEITNNTPRTIDITVNSAVSSAGLYSLTSTGGPTATKTWSNTNTFTLNVPDEIVVLKLNLGTSQAATSLGVADNFEAQTVNAAPTGWTVKAGDNWLVKGDGTNKFVQETDASGDHYLAKTISATNVSFLTDFDYTWQGGGTSTYGDYGQTVGYDVTDLSGNGYRVEVHQGDSGVAANDTKLTEIYKLNAGVPDASPLATGGGYNRAGWVTLGYAKPVFHRLRVSDEAGVFTVYGDTNYDGTYDVLATASDATYNTFTRLKLRSLDMTNSTGPEFDNVETSTPTVSVQTTNATAAENPSDAGVFTLTRTGSTANALTVAFNVLGTATEGTDYATIAHTVTFAAGAATATVTITPTSDTAVEGNESVVLSLVEGAAYHVASNARTDDLSITDYAPDLVITGITLANPTPLDGDLVKFSVVVKNIGNAPTPSSQPIHLGFIFDQNGGASIGSTKSNTSIAPGGVLTLTSSTGGPNSDGAYKMIAGQHLVTAWVDANSGYNGTNGNIPESNDSNNEQFMLYRVASSRTADDFETGQTVDTPPTNWTPTGDGWTVRNTAGDNYTENTTTGTGTRTISRTISSAGHKGSWSLDFAHAWRWGGYPTQGTGQHSLSVSADVVDSSGNGYRVRFYQGDSNTPANDSSLVKIFKMTAGTEGTTPLASGIGFNAPGWLSQNLAAPVWRRARITYDVGTRTISVLADLTGTGVYQMVASAVDKSTVRAVTTLAFNAEGLAATVGPEFDDIRMDLFPYVLT